MPLEVFEMPRIMASSSIDPYPQEDLQLFVDTGTSPSLIHPEKLSELWGTASASRPFTQVFLQEPLVFRSMDMTFEASSYIICTLRIGSGLHTVRFFEVPDLPVDAIVGNGLVVNLGIRFNHNRGMVRLKLPRKSLVPGYVQLVNSKGALMSCQWVPMYYNQYRYEL